ncbi:MAG: peptide deformylase [Pseudomonadales bacterium]|jgi:peptide deformylase|nr:peptide deformylase [Pseudomonadales bacterium]MDP7359042.1 peptide deformylase [Pseudomonadales bacterium]HJN52163.1 peptide deformylase [Pseudomonadales bacterium]|tara:strand:- start:411 stop:947 length:537 start_codon:yes stop_codon:yes gene_type:complete
MAVLEIVRMGHPVLRQAARALLDDEIGGRDIAELVGDMVETLHASSGIGLAAPQVNRSIQLAVIEIVESASRYGEIDTLPLTIFVNPSITLLSEETAGHWEGCLSIPAIRGFVERPQHIEVSYQDLCGKAHNMVLEGFLATVMQHEFDHLAGTLFIDRVKDTRLLSFEEEYLTYQTQP